MKKNNYVVTVLAVAVSIFLLWLWYHLGLNQVDNPLDLVLSIIWWALTALIVVGIVRFEKSRQRQIRTIYVSPNALYNSERGVVSVAEAAQKTDVMESILQELKYDFSNEDMPEQDEFEYQYVVQTDKYKKGDENAEDEKDQQPTWEGKLIKIDRQNGNIETKFEDLDQLKAALAA